MISKKHPIDMILSKYNSSRYKLSKSANISEMALSHMVNRNVAVDSLKIGLVNSIAIECSLSIEEAYNELKKYEKED